MNKNTNKTPNADAIPTGAFNPPEKLRLIGKKWIAYAQQECDVNDIAVAVWSAVQDTSNQASAQIEALQAQVAALTLERDASNVAARAQTAKLMAMTDHPDGNTLLREVLARCEPAAVKSAKEQRDAYKWGYSYLQDRMRSLSRFGWAEDCDSEIESRVDAARRAA